MLVISQLEGTFVMCHFVLVFNSLCRAKQRTFANPPLSDWGKNGLRVASVSCDSSKTSWCHEGLRVFQTSLLNVAVLY